MTRECPFINECTAEVGESYFKMYCRPRFGILISYKDCWTYRNMSRERQGLPSRQTPQKWKKEKEG